MSKRKRDIVEITWEDSSGYNGGWVSKNQRLPVSICRSIGWIHKENKHRIELAPHYSKYQTAGNMCIPRSAIRSIRRVR